MFGNIKNGEMMLNEAGEMVKHWYLELNNKFNDIKCHAMVVMPNHFHCIIENVGATAVPVGADLCVCPNDPGERNDDHSGERERNILGGHNDDHSGEHKHDILGEHIGSPLRDIIRWFKTMTTNHYIRGVKQRDWPPFDGKLWQRNYWEHIIRDLYEYQNIEQYIINNPQKWENDRLK